MQLRVNEMRILPKRIFNNQKEYLYIFLNFLLMLRFKGRNEAILPKTWTPLDARSHNFEYDRTSN